MNGIEGVHAIVTGGARGIGAAIAEAHARAGARLTLIGRDAHALARHAERLGGDVVTAPCDVADEAAVDAAFERAAARFGAAGILVNNAGVARGAPFQDIALADWNRTLAVNLTGAFLCTRRALPAMLASGRGRIVNIASTAGLKGVARIAPYCASKHGLIGLTRALAAEVARRGITVNAVCPGYTESDMAEQAIVAVMAGTGQSRAGAEAAIHRSNAVGRLVQPREVADTVVWLCSDGAAAITGEAIVVGGAV
jgi:NAD(P)-dependent dehydrogenase (short-subunit alcohol dehydrogenase family)